MAQSNGYAIIDAKGVRFRITNPGASAEPEATNEYVNRKVADIVVSENGDYLAYRFGGGDLFVLCMTDGAVLGRFQTSLTDGVAAISDDARFVLLVDDSLGPGETTVGPAGPPPQTVTLLDTSSGERTPLGAVQALLDRFPSYHFLNGGVWLGSDHVFVLQLEGRTASNGDRMLYEYDPQLHTLTKLEGLERVTSAGPGGLMAVVMESPGSSHSVGEVTQRPVVYQHGTVTEFAFDAGYKGSSGALGTSGSVAVMEIEEEQVAGIMGWQVFRPSQNMWRAVSRLWAIPASHEYGSPIATTDDGAVAWGYGWKESATDPTHSEQVLVSLDTGTGTWSEWFTAEDLEVAPLEFQVIRVVFEN